MGFHFGPSSQRNPKDFCCLTSSIFNIDFYLKLQYTGLVEAARCAVFGSTVVFDVAVGRILYVDKNLLYSNSTVFLQQNISEEAAHVNNLHRALTLSPPAGICSAKFSLLYS